MGINLSQSVRTSACVAVAEASEQQGGVSKVQWAQECVYVCVQRHQTANATGSAAARVSCATLCVSVTCLARLWHVAKVLELAVARLGQAPCGLPRWIIHFIRGGAVWLGACDELGAGRRDVACPKGLVDGAPIEDKVACAGADSSSSASDRGRQQSVARPALQISKGV